MKKILQKINHKISLDFIFCFIILLITLYLFFATYLKWGSFILDSGYGLWIPEQLLLGKKLYKDIFYEYGFFSVYLVAFFYKIFGISSYVIIGIGLAITIAMSYVLYFIAKFILSAHESFFVVLTFLLVCAYGYYDYNGIFNFIFPYSLPSTLSLLLTSISLYFLLRYFQKTKRSYLFAIVFFMCASFCTRIEYSFLILIGQIIASILFAFKEKKWIVSKELLITFCAIFFFSAFVYVTFLIQTDSLGIFVRMYSDTLYSFSNNNIMTKSLMGLSDLKNNLIFIVTSFIFLTLILLAVLLVTNLLLKFFNNKLVENKRNNYISFALLLLIVIYWAKRFFSIEEISGSEIFYPLQLILMINILFSFYMIFAQATQYKKHLMIFCISLMGLLSLYRIFLHSLPLMHGFVLIPLALVGLYYYSFYLFGELYLKITKTKYFFQPLYSLIVMVVLLQNLFDFWSISKRAYDSRIVQLKFERGGIKVQRDELNYRMAKTIEYIGKNIPEDKSVVVFPEGLLLNFYTKRINPTGYGVFNPVGIDIFGEENIIGKFKKLKIDYFIFLQRDASDHGYRAFGTDYAKRLYAWILENYLIEDTIGPYPFTTNHFGVAILRNKNIRKQQIQNPLPL
ncbi:MAG: hypothetical protein HQK49_15535 [Oligoflexia bacterium]|nr:hypothetical protein [Oligoflexia bacterium]